MGSCPYEGNEVSAGRVTCQDRSLVCLRPSTSGRVDPLPSLRAGRCRPGAVRQGLGQARRRPDRAPRSGSVGEGPARPAPPAWTDTVHGAVPGGRRAAGPAAHPRHPLPVPAHGRIRWLQLDQGSRRGARPRPAGQAPQPVRPDRLPRAPVDDAGRDRQPGLPGAAFGPWSYGENHCARRLPHLLGPDLPAPADRDSDDGRCPARVACTGALPGPRRSWTVQARRGTPLTTLRCAPHCPGRSLAGRFVSFDRTTLLPNARHRAGHGPISVRLRSAAHRI